MRRGDTAGPWTRTDNARVFVRAISNVRNKAEFARGVLGYEPGILQPARAGDVMCPTCFWSFTPYKAGNARRHDCTRPTATMSRTRSGGVRQIRKLFHTPAAAFQAGVNRLEGAAAISTLTLPFAAP